MNTVASADGTTIAYDATGAGPPLVLVVGAFCDRHTTRSLTKVLAPDFTVYEYDRRGRGESGDTAPYAVEREVEDLAAVAGAAGGAPNVFGHSSGAILALEAAARGVPMARLVAYEPPYIIGDTRPRPGSDVADRLSALVSDGRRGDAAKLFLTEAVGMPAEVVSMIEGSPDWAGMTALAHTLAYDVTTCGPATSYPRARSRRSMCRRWCSVAATARSGSTPPFARWPTPCPTHSCDSSPARITARPTTYWRRCSSSSCAADGLSRRPARRWPPTTSCSPATARRRQVSCRRSIPRR